MLPHLSFHIGGDIRIVPEIMFDGTPPLSDTGFSHGEPGAGFLDDVEFDSQIHQVVPLGDSFSVDDFKLGLPEWRSHLVLDNLCPDPVP